MLLEELQNQLTIVGEKRLFAIFIQPAECSPIETSIFTHFNTGSRSHQGIHILYKFLLFTHNFV
jgi:hypothetical protein